MRVLKNLKSLFIVESPEAGVQEQTVPQAPRPREAAEMETTAPHPPHPDPSPVSGPDERFLGVLLSAMEENNVDGFDYLEFRESLRSLEKVPMDEATRFRSAYAMAQTLKADLTHLLRSGRVYLNVLEQERKKFEEALKGREATEIRSRQERMHTLDQDIAAMQAEIERLMEAITRSRKEKESIEGEMLESHRRMEETSARFQATLEFVSGEIREDLRKMEQHIKP